MRKTTGTAVDRLLADPRRQAVMEAWTARMRAGRPWRWHRLIHDVLQCQMHASPDLASVVEMKWLLAQSGIATHIVSEWMTL
jgi:hypothetical protein